MWLHIMKKGVLLKFDNSYHKTECQHFILQKIIFTCDLYNTSYFTFWSIYLFNVYIYIYTLQNGVLIEKYYSSHKLYIPKKVSYLKSINVIQKLSVNDWQCDIFSGDLYITSYFLYMWLHIMKKGVLHVLYNCYHKSERQCFIFPKITYICSLYIYKTSQLKK